MTASRVPDEWPALPYAEWSDTKKTLQMLTQILGKLRLAIEPQKPEWLAAALYPTARGLTTRPMPWGTASVELTLDFFDHTLSVLMSDGRSHRIPLAPSRCVAEIYEELMADLAQLGIEVEIYTKPQEVPDTTPFPENRHDCAYDPEAVQRFFRVLTAVAGVFDEWRSRFFGKTAEQFWWGSFDLSVIRFSGKHAVAPDDKGYIMRYDLDAEFFTAGWWPGSDDSPEPGFYAYAYPTPQGCESVEVRPEHAGWVEAMGEWMMGYDAVRDCPDPRQAIVDFLHSTYGAVTALGEWDAKALEYTAPPPAAREG
jgi:hypothetical protein